MEVSGSRFLVCASSVDAPSDAAGRGQMSAWIEQAIQTEPSQWTGNIEA